MGYLIFGLCIVNILITVFWMRLIVQEYKRNRNYYLEQQRRLRMDIEDLQEKVGLITSELDFEFSFIYNFWDRKKKGN